MQPIVTTIEVQDGFIKITTPGFGFNTVWRTKEMKELWMWHEAIAGAVANHHASAMGALMPCPQPIASTKEAAPIPTNQHNTMKLTKDQQLLLRFHEASVMPSTLEEVAQRCQAIDYQERHYLCELAKVASTKEEPKERCTTCGGPKRAIYNGLYGDKFCDDCLDRDAERYKESGEQPPKAEPHDPLRWPWMMEWCKKRGLVPGMTENWLQARKAWDQEQQKPEAQPPREPTQQEWEEAMDQASACFNEAHEFPDMAHETDRVEWIDQKTLSILRNKGLSVD